jgi:nitrogen fixation/metabolism regulation signal transduction histidine kinase
MVRLKQLRGSGVRYTLPYVLPFSGLWLVVTIIAMVVFGVTCWLAASTSPRLDDAARTRLALVLMAQTLFLIAAVFALAVFTTNRLAGPYIAIIRAFEAVKNGDLDRPLRFRSSDIHLRDVEISFQEMMAALRVRLEPQGGAQAGTGEPALGSAGTAVDLPS